MLAAMHTPYDSLLRRLRLSRRAWLLVAVAMLIKLATATACLLDGPGLAIAPAGEADGIHLVMAQASPAGDEACVLDEAGGCHCACAHAVTLPAAAFDLATVALLPTYAARAPLTPSLRVAASPLRPPIA